MIAASFALVIGLVLLIWSAERFVDGAVASAYHLKLSPLIVGTVIVGIGTSAPEFVVSGLSAWAGQPGLAIGNAYGSNIANVGLVLGVTVLIAPLFVDTRIVRRELITLAGATLVSLALILDGIIGHLDALLLVALLAGYLVASVVHGRRHGADVANAAGQTSQPTPSPEQGLRSALFWLIAGLILLIVASRLLVWGAVAIATAMGVSDLIIGLTVVAVGTSLPELASSISALRRDAHDLVIGNVIGSNLFNTLGVVGVAGLLTPIDIDPYVITRDWPVMAVMTLALAFCLIRLRTRHVRINRYQGAILFTSFLAYTAWLIAGGAGAT